MYIINLKSINKVAQRNLRETPPISHIKVSLLVRTQLVNRKASYLLCLEYSGKTIPADITVVSHYLLQEGYVINQTTTDEPEQKVVNTLA